MCVRPMQVKGNVVPCGKCFECKRSNRNSWAIRLIHEIKKGSFVTLTYNEDEYPGQLVKKDLQDYIKRVREELRRKNKQFKLIYFGVGEYGKRTQRAHYHIIFNITDTDVIKEKWQKGIVHLGEVNEQTILYTTKYIQKNHNYKEKETDYRQKEFRLMSKEIGKTYLNKHGEHHIRNKLLYLMNNGIKYPLPRYYRDKLFGMILGKDDGHQWYIDKVDGHNVKKQVDKETGEIKPANVIREKTDLSDKIEEKQLKKMKELAEKYKNLLKSEINENLLLRAEKYQKMYEMLNIKKQVKNGKVQL